MTDGQRQLTIVCKVREGMKKIEEKNKEKNKIIIVLTFIGTCDNISLVLVRAILQRTMREWLSGGAPPCQGGGRGFDSRLALFLLQKGISDGDTLFAIEKRSFSNPLIT